jgi:hypothetical protein
VGLKGSYNDEAFAFEGFSEIRKSPSIWCGFMKTLYGTLMVPRWNWPVVACRVSHRKIG